MKRLAWVLAAQGLVWGQTPDDAIRLAQQDALQAQQMADLARRQAEALKEVTTDFGAANALQRANQQLLQLQSMPALNMQQQDAMRRLEEDLRLRKMDLDLRGRDLAFMQGPGAPPVPPVPPKVWSWVGPEGKVTDEERLYRSGKSALEDREWDKAVSSFRRVADRKGARADAALYWLAYAQNKMGRRGEAQATLATLLRDFPGSRWLDDAKALDLEVKQSAGQPVSPESEADEDLKILALNGMIHTDPERATPVLQNLLQKSTSPRLKERALFVLAQSKAPQAREVIVKLARGGGNPDLQYKAIEYLGYHNTAESRQMLGDLYSGASDPLVKRAVIRSYAIGRDKERLVAVVRGEQNAELRKEAIRGLGQSGADAELWQLYQGEQNADTKVEILRALPGNKESIDRLLDYAKSEKDPKVRRELVQQVGYIRHPKASEALPGMYAGESDVTVRRAILDALYSQKNAKALVDIAKTEKDAGLRRNVVERLSHMKSKEAQDYLVELLNK
ncbi:MAG: HEAT repeat domain-containing protein [Bryobacterales bacterium]|nr:HEAT repeat domain-containing protein [Bryobacterales bacterium]